ncbi:SDR family oxidoreductase [Leucobacter salsicius]|uniref:SDR family oxidoreductase n=1 Tax=Leucobacter salsicius TaxID=664638 RepID=UPI00047669E4|nr:SDR family oxidoreductase [Leucobacter salsicius]
MPNKSDQPVALVTGASSGMGREIARDLGRTHRVILVGRDAERLAAAVVDAGSGAEGWQLELTDYEAVAARIAALDRLDAVVHAAAIGGNRSVHEAMVGDWERSFAVNVTAPAMLTKQALPLVRASRGTIVFIGSGASTRPVPGSAIYAASKHALQAVADVLRIDEEPHFVRVATVAPGQTDTAMLRGMVGDSGYRPELYIQPSSVAQAVRYVVDAPADVQITDVAVRPRREIARI